MKTKVSIIIGLLLLLIGGSMMIVAATRDDFDIDNILFTNIEFEEKLYNAEEVNSISFTADADCLKIIRSDRTDIRVLGKKGDHLEYNYYINKNNTLVIKQDTKGILGGFIDLNIFGTMSSDNAFIIEVPSTYTGTLNIDIDAGDVSIINYEASNINIDVDAGSINLENINAQSLEAHVEMGDIDIINSYFGTSNISVELGDIDANLGITSALSLEVEVGDINLQLIGTDDLYNVNNDGSGTIRIRLEVELGDYDYSFS